MPRILGLDIEDHVVKAALVRTSFGRVEPLRYLEVPVARLSAPAPVPITHRHQGDQGEAITAVGLLGDGGDGAEAPIETVITPEEPVPDAELPDLRREAIAEILAAIRPPPDQIFVGLDGKEASLRTVELPVGTVKKGRVAEVLPFILDDLVPFDMDDTIVEHQIIRTGEEVVTVLATAVPRSTVAKRLAELQSLGIDPRGMPVGAAALDGLAALVPSLSENGPHLILEIEHGNTEICILEDGVCVFARSLALGLEELSDPATQRRALGALRRTLSAYRAAGGTPATHAYLAGDGISYAEQLIPVLSPILMSLGANLAFSPLPMPAAPGADERNRPRFARAAALAGRAVVRGKRIDVRQGEFAQKRTMGAIRQHARLVAICTVAIALSFVYATYAKYSVLSEENELLTEQLRQTTEDLFGESTANAERANALLEGGRQTQDPLPHMDSYAVLEAITAAIPVETEHTTRRLTIEIDDQARTGRFDLQGTVASIADRDTIAANLESHDCFRDLDKGPTSPGRGNEGLNYRLEVNIVCPGDEPPEQESRRSRRRGRN